MRSGRLRRGMMPEALGCLIGLAVVPGVYAQERPDRPVPRDSLLAAAREIVTAARYCALVTVAEDGRLQARAIDAFLPDEHWVIRIGTSRHTRKVDEVARDPRVTLYYFDRGSMSYVTIQGMARLETDPAERERYWKPEWEAFYPDRETDYVLLTVTPERLEVVSEVRGITGDARTWRPPAVELAGSR
jgi:general stress protein 26